MLLRSAHASGTRAIWVSLAFTGLIASSQDLEERSEARDRIRACGIEVVSTGIEQSLAAVNPRLSGTDAPISDAGRAIAELARAVSEYPTGICQCAGSSRVFLVWNLEHVANRDGWGRPHRWRSDARGLSHSRSRTIVLSVERPGLEQTFHHEFFHLIDHADADDPEWSGLNARNFEYGLVSARRGPRPSIALPPGFLSFYSLYSPSEDKAELFSFLFAQPDRVAERASEDGILSEKVALLRARLRSICPDS